MSSPSGEATPPNPLKRPAAGGHHRSTDWVARLHKRHDAKRHPERQQEQRPLLADDHPNEPADAEVQAAPPPRKDRIKPARDCLAKIQEGLKKGLSKVKDGVKGLAQISSKGAKKSKRAVENNPKKVLGTIIAFLSATTGFFGTMYGRHIHYDKAYQLCITADCISAAFTILQNLHPNAISPEGISSEPHYSTTMINPCTDFDQYVCGGYGKKHDLRIDQGTLSTETVMADRVDSALRKILTKSIDNVVKKDRDIFQKLMADYNSCMDEKQINDLGLAPLKELVSHIKKLLPTNEPSMPSPDPPQHVAVAEHTGKGSITDVMIFIQKLGVKALVSFDVRADDHTPSRQIIHASPAQEVDLLSAQFSDHPNIMTDYQNAVEQTIGLFYDIHANTSFILDHRPGMRIKVADLAQGVLQLELELATIVPAKENLMDPVATYNKMNITEFDEHVQQMSLTSMIKSLAPPDYKPDHVIVAAPDYIQRLSFLLQKTPREVIQAFFVWKVIQHYADRVEVSGLATLNEFNSNLRGAYVQYPAERWRRCAQEVDKDLGWIASRFYIEEHFSQSTQEAAKNIIENVKLSFSSIMADNTWISSDIRDRAAKKAIAVVSHLGYPARNPDLRNPGNLKDYYKHVDIRNDAFFNNKLEVSKFNCQHQWSKLGKPTNSNEWKMTATIVKAYYEPTSNQAFFPAGVLQFPALYGNSVPEYLSYGSFGVIAGHDIAHAFGTHGSQYDGKGQFAPLWDNKTQQAFQAKSDCFVKQYSKYAIQGPKSSHRVNGNLTLEESIADTGGAHAAFEAWKKRESKAPGKLLPGLQQFSKAQLFWLSFGNFHCSKTTKEAAVQEVYSSTHAPESIRVLGTVANSRGFREAFNCPIKKPMCEMW